MKIGITFGFAALGALGITPSLGDTGALIQSTHYAPPAACVQWYDGCNVCEKNTSGNVSCSHRSCAATGRGFCTANENLVSANTQ